MKKKLLATFAACFLVCIVIMAGRLYGEITSESKIGESKEVPVYENTSLYAKVAFSELISESTYIVVAEVVEIGETYAEVYEKYPIENIPEGVTVLYPLRTPVTLKVQNAIKGAEAGDEIIFYMDGGVTDKYAIRSNSHELEKGTKLFLFLGSDGLNWGGQGEFLVDGENVILSAGVLEYLDSEAISKVDTETMSTNVSEQFAGQNVNVMKLDKFIEKVESMMQQK